MKRSAAERLKRGGAEIRAKRLKRGGAERFKNVSTRAGNTTRGRA